MEIIHPDQYEEVFTLVVTQERLGQIQCDLSYLLDIEEDVNYPWAVYIDDLESFLITLRRKKNFTQEFVEFLLAREQLQGRVICYDELELCAYFLFNRKEFIRQCEISEMFFSSPDVDGFFDLLYEVGFGLPDELNLQDKLKRRSAEATALVRKHQLALPLRIGKRS